MKAIRRYIVGFVIAACCAPVFADTVFIQPSSQAAGPGSTLIVKIAINNASDLYAWQFDLGFDPDIVSAVDITEGTFLATGGPTLFLPGVIDNVGGAITFNADTLVGFSPGVNGDGILAIVDFVANQEGATAINIFNTIFLDSNLAGIDTAIVNGEVAVAATSAGVPEPSSGLLGLCAIGLSLWALRMRNPGGSRERSR